MKCKFDIAWCGSCGKDADESGFCEKHRNIKCTSCGSQAARECDASMGVVCGFPLCGNCEHTSDHNHRPKSVDAPAATGKDYADKLPQQAEALAEKIWTEERLHESVSEWKKACREADEFNFVSGWAFATSCFIENYPAALTDNSEVPK